MERISDISSKTHIDTGSDSDVYLLNDLNCIIKVYSGLREGLLRPTELDRCRTIVQRYRSDTMIAKDIVDSEWTKAPFDFREIILDDFTYTLTPKILLQGDCKTMDAEVVLIGQEYLPVINLQRIIQGYGSDQKIYRVMNSKQEKLKDMVQHIADFVNEKMGIRFSLALKNVMPVINESERTIDMVITDLEGGIGKLYAPMYGYSYLQII